MCLAALCLTPAAGAQCLLANPSFELGTGLDGWNRFGDTAVESAAVVHGAKAAAIRGPGLGSWAVSGVWQPFDASPGERFAARVRAGHADADPLTGQASAILNIEWRDGAGALIAYESHQLVTAADPTGEMRTFDILSAPAPAGTASTRLLLGTLQSPAQEPGAAIYDLAEFVRQTTPSYDESQWDDFPGGRRLSFAGREWRVKGPGTYGPGPNLFMDGQDHVWVDGDDLHMTIRRAGSAWASTEITLEEALGYGDYVFTTRGRLDTLADNVVLGLFLWQYPPCYLGHNVWNQHNEIDVEISRWGDPANDVAQFVVQPWDFPGSIDRFDIAYQPDELVSYAFLWLPDRIEYRAWRGGPDDESPATLIRSWTYAGPHIPRPEQPRVHINLWRLGDAPSDGEAQEVVMPAFAFTPACCLGEPGVDALYEWRRDPTDLNLDGVADEADGAELRDHLRAPRGGGHARAQGAGRVGRPGGHAGRASSTRPEREPESGGTA